MYAELAKIFMPAMATKIAQALTENQVTSLDGLRFELSGRIISVFRQKMSGRALICQIEC